MIIKWDTAVLNLRGKGWTYKQIGARVGVTEAAVSKWVSAKSEPRWKPGWKLLDMHFDKCPEKHMDLMI
jgi:transcriptional regulator with XRE-family HTH domain